MNLTKKICKACIKKKHTELGYKFDDGFFGFFEISWEYWHQTQCCVLGGKTIPIADRKLPLWEKMEEGYLPPKCYYFLEHLVNHKAGILTC